MGSKHKNQEECAGDMGDDKALDYNGDMLFFFFFGLTTKFVDLSSPIRN